jgi:hypothetical protein
VSVTIQNAIASLLLAINAFLRCHARICRGARIVSWPLRNAGVPVLTGPGRGLRVSVGDSTLLRVLSRVEPELEDAWTGHIRTGDVVWDVGANMALLSIWG